MPEVQPPSAPNELRVPVVEESAVVGTRTVEKARVRVRTATDEREELLRELLMREDVRIERVAIGRPIDAMPSPREEGNVTIIPIVDEIAVVEKRLVLREELHVVRVRTAEPVEQRVTLRSTRAVVERTRSPEPQPPEGVASMRTITAFFDDRTEANRAQEQLRAIGVSDVDIIDQSSPGYTSEGYSTHENRGFWASLKDMFLPDADRHAYEEGIRRGGYLLTARADEANADRVIDILDDEGTVDMQKRQDQWRQEGWAAPSVAGSAMGSSASGGGSTMDRGTTAGRETREERIPLMEEELRVGKREVARGGVRVHSYVTETPVHEQVTLRDEHVSVERRPVDRTPGTSRAPMDGDAFRDRSVEMTETAEEAVVDKQARVREEVVVRKDVDEHVEDIDDTVRRTEVDIDRGAGIDRLAAEGGSTDRDSPDSDPTRRDRMR